MRYVSKCIPKQMRLQPLPENVCTERRVSEVVRQRIPGHRTGDREPRRPSVLRRRRGTRRWFPGLYKLRPILCTQTGKQRAMIRTRNDERLSGIRRLQRLQNRVRLLMWSGRGRLSGNHDGVRQRVHHSYRSIRTLTQPDPTTLSVIKQQVTSLPLARDHLYLTQPNATTSAVIKQEVGSGRDSSCLVMCRLKPSRDKFSTRTALSKAHTSTRYQQSPLITIKQTPARFTWCCPYPVLLGMIRH